MSPPMFPSAGRSPSKTSPRQNSLLIWDEADVGLFFTLEEPAQRLVLEQLLIRDHREADLKATVARHEDRWPSANRALCWTSEFGHMRIPKDDMDVDDDDDGDNDDDNDDNDKDEADDEKVGSINVDTESGPPQHQREYRLIAHDLKACFHKQWEFAVTGGADDRWGLNEANWSAFDLYRDNDDAPLKTCAPYMLEHRRCSGNCELHWRKKLQLCRTITSPLLLYRLIVIFGAQHDFADRLDGDKSCWGIRLQRVGDEESRLEFYDNKGWARVKFSGKDKTSDGALALLSFLVSNWVPQ